MATSPIRMWLDTVHLEVRDFQTWKIGSLKIVRNTRGSKDVLSGRCIWAVLVRVIDGWHLVLSPGFTGIRPPGAAALLVRPQHHLLLSKAMIDTYTPTNNIKEHRPASLLHIPWIFHSCADRQSQQFVTEIFCCLKVVVCFIWSGTSASHATHQLIS